MDAQEDAVASEENETARTKKRTWIPAVIAVVAVLAVAIFFLQKLLMPKYMTDIPEGAFVEEYYDETLDHEVLFVGDCEVYENFSTMTLYENYGITSYIRGSAQQLTWQSYYMLEDTLRYETPEVVVFNVLALKYDKPQSEAYNRMTLDGMKFSEVKLEDINASMTSSEHMVDYLFPILRYHSRWSELTSEDLKYMFHKDKVTHNGYYMRVDVRPVEDFPEPDVLADPTLGSNAMDYLDRMRRLCEDNGIDFVLVKSPSLYPYWYEEWDEQIVDYAAEYGLDYFNYVDLADEVGIDYNTDTYDAGLHLNVAGAEKMADYFGKYLTETYDLTDYRTDPTYAEVYEEKIQFYNDMKEAQYQELEEYGEIRSF